MSSTFVQLYRSSLICDVLTEALEELMEEAKLDDNLARKVLGAFDKAALEALAQRAEAKAQLTGSLTTYNYFDNVWLFEVSGATLRLAVKTASAISTAPKVTADKIKLICVDSKLCQGAS